MTLHLLPLGVAVAQATGVAPCETTAELRRHLTAVSAEQRLYGGRLRIVNVYKQQAEALLDSTASDSAVVGRWSRDVYPQHLAFWRGYVGDSADFARMATALVRYRRILLCDRIPKLLAVGLQTRFERHARWLTRMSGLSPVGTWYLAYGHGATDMGGLGAIGMVIDFSNQVADSAALEGLLTHELAHQIHGRRVDPDSGTVLERVIAEGLATYVACRYAAGRRTPANCIGYSDEMWAWSVRHERALVAAVRPLLWSRSRASLDSVASRSITPIAGGPSAVGYFLGYRVVEAYVRRHGARSWTTLLRAPVRTVLRSSGYRF